MAGKIRVHQLARELGVPVKQVLAWLHEQGETVRSGSSTLEAPVARRIREDHDALIALGNASGDVAGALKQSRPKFQPAPQSSPPVRPVRTGQAGHNSTVAAVGDPPHSFVRHADAAAVHHRDYLNGRRDRSLCGREGLGPIPLDDVPEAICTECLERLPEYHAKWWRAQFLAVASDLDQLRNRYAKIEGQLRSRTRDQVQRHPNPKPKRNSAQAPVKKAGANKTGAKRAGARQAKKGTGAQTSRGPLSALGIPIVNKSSHPVPATTKRPADRKAVQRRLREMAANEPQRPKTPREIESDEMARESMRSHKPSHWRLGKPPSRGG